MEFEWVKSTDEVNRPLQRRWSMQYISKATTQMSEHTKKNVRVPRGYKFCAYRGDDRILEWREKEAVGVEDTQCGDENSERKETKSRQKLLKHVEYFINFII